MIEWLFGTWSPAWWAAGVGMAFIAGYHIGRWREARFERQTRESFVRELARVAIERGQHGDVVTGSREAREGAQVTKPGVNRYKGHCRGCGCDFTYGREDTKKHQPFTFAGVFADMFVCCPSCGRQNDHFGERGTDP